MIHVTPFVRYLAIPSGFALTNDLCWSTSGEAIEYADGRTFILTDAIPSFLEGYAAQRPLIHFAYVLDLLRLVLEPNVPMQGISLHHQKMVCEGFRSTGRQLRNAGAFGAWLTRKVSPTWIPGSGLGLVTWFANCPVYPTMANWSNLEEPYLDAASFRRIVSDALDTLTERDVYHWMRFGQSPLGVEGKRLADEIVVVKPPAYQGTLDDLVRKRPRLAGALPLVGTMVSALTLPPRRRSPPELPIGGYADVTTRGDPAQLLPSQFALDPDEFVRRFAEKELLFFRREEPHRRTREQLVLLVDQGVRTWGPVRLALSAAVLAFRRLADKREVPFFVRFGSAPKDRIDPSINWEQLADRLEASELSAVPIDLLYAESYDDPDESDLVLLTHPRTIRENDVRFYAGLLPRRKRFFTLTVDDEGSAHFSEMRGGEPVPISRFRVDFSSRTPEPAGCHLEEERWTGDVEPVPSPFAIGPFQKVVALGFDHDATRMFVATQRGYLHLYRLSDGRLEMLPRAEKDGEVLLSPDSIIGVHGGIVVGGMIHNALVAAHYDLAKRTVKVHSLGLPGEGPMRWYAFPEIQSIAVRQIAACRGLDLVTGAMYAEPEQPPSINARAQHAYLQALLREFPGPTVPVAIKQFGHIAISLPKPHLEHDRETGRITVHRDGGSKSLLPHSDGSLLFTGDIIKFVQVAGSALAIRTQRTKHDGTHFDWFLFDTDESSSLHEIPAVYNDEKLNHLSPDGRYFARYWAHGQFVVYRIGSTSPILTTAPGRVHNPLSVQLGRTSLNIIIGAKQHVLSWPDGPLHHSYERVRKDDTLDHATAVDCSRTHPFFTYDPARFYAYASKDVDAVIDAAGQVIIFDPHRNRLACLFLMWRDELAIWLPDGTRYGPPQLTGGPAWPNALEKIGNALRAAGTVK